MMKQSGDNNTTDTGCWSRRPVLALIVFGVIAFVEFVIRENSPVKAIIKSINMSDTIVKDAETKRIDDTVARWINELSLKEKCDLLRGSVESRGYTGFVPGNSRLGIPSLRMNDGPQGFRGPKRTSTAWPCKYMLVC